MLQKTITLGSAKLKLSNSEVPDLSLATSKTSAKP